MVILSPWGRSQTVFQFRVTLLAGSEASAANLLPNLNKHPNDSTPPPRYKQGFSRVGTFQDNPGRILRHKEPP